MNSYTVKKFNDKEYCILTINGVLGEWRIDNKNIDKVKLATWFHGELEPETIWCNKIVSLSAFIKMENVLTPFKKIDEMYKCKGIYLYWDKTNEKYVISIKISKTKYRKTCESLRKHGDKTKAFEMAKLRYKALVKIYS